jgi:hypothetical protein
VRVAGPALWPTDLTVRVSAVLSQVDEVIPQNVWGDLVRAIPVLGFVLYLWYQTRQETLDLRKELSATHERMLTMQAESTDRLLTQNTEVVPMLRECVAVLKEVSILLATTRRIEGGG